MFDKQVLRSYFQFTRTGRLTIDFNFQVISDDIKKLQQNHTDQLAKIEQYKRKFLELSHRVLQVILLYCKHGCLQAIAISNGIGCTSLSTFSRLQ